MFIFDLLGGLVGLAVVVIIIGLLSGNLFYVVKQQHAVIIERLASSTPLWARAFTSRFRSSTARLPR